MPGKNDMATIFVILLLPHFFLPLSHLPTAAIQGGWVGLCYNVFFFQDYEMGGQKRINKRISVIVLAFGVKWSILSVVVIRFCGSQKDFLFHSCISSWMTESLTFRASFLFWRGDQSLVFTLLFYIPWKHSVLFQTRLHGRTGTGNLSSWSCVYLFCNEDFPFG